eukprot:gene4570-5807_t
MLKMVVNVNSSVISGILLVLSVCVGYIDSYHVIVLGDSYDRFMVQAMCRPVEGNLTFWSDNLLSYLDNQEATLRCSFDKHNISITTVMIFGSPVTGPYSLQYWLKYQHPTMIITTPERMRYAIDRYFSLFNQTPDVVFFHTTLWDFKMVVQDFTHFSVPANTPGTKEFDQAVSRYYRSYQERLHELYGILKRRGIERTTRIALRTAFEIPFAKRCLKTAYPVIGAINQAVSTLAEQMQLSLYDFNYEVESEFFGHYDNCRYVLFDDAHVHRSMSASTGRKLAGLQYTSAMSWRPADGIQLLPITDTFTPIRNRHHALHTNASMQETMRTWRALVNVSQEAFLVTDRHPRHFHNLTALATESGVVPHLYFLTYVNGQPRRHGNVTLGFLELFRLGESDVAPVGPKRLQAIPVSYAIPRSFQTSLGRFPDGVVARLVSESDREALHASEEEVQSVCGSGSGDGAAASSNKSFEYYHVYPGCKKPIVRSRQGDKLACQDMHAVFARVGTKQVVHVPWSLLDYMMQERWIML